MPIRSGAVSCRATIWWASRSTGSISRVLRRFPLVGRAMVEGTFEVFNVFNHANYGNCTRAESSRVYGNPRQNLNVAYLPRMAQLGFRLTF